MNHWVWDDDLNESLCGEDMSKESWVVGEVDCKSCIEVDGLISHAEQIYEQYPLNALAIAFATKAA